MPYVQRNSENVIIGVYRAPQYEAHEWDDPPEEWVPIAVEELTEDHPDLKAFREERSQRLFGGGQ